MDIQNKTNEEFKNDIRELHQEIYSLKVQIEKSETALIIANKELAFQNGEKGKRAQELIIANIELEYQTEEKEKRAQELIIANLALVTEKELIEAKEKAEESEIKFHNLFENSPIAKSITGIDGSLMVNKSFCDILGYSKKELENKKWQDLTFPEDIEKSDKIAQSLLQGKNKKIMFEKRYVHKNGHIVYAEVSTFLQRDNDNNPQYFITAFNDITERKQTLELLHQSEEFSSSLLKNIPFGMSIVDAEGNILFINENLKKYSGKEHIGQKCWQLYRDNKLQCADCPLLTKIEIGESSVSQIDGFFGEKTFEISHTGMMFQGKKAILEIFQDITEQKQSEIELIKAKDKVEESEEKFRRAFFSAPFPIIIHAEDGEVVSINQALTDLTGYSHKDIPTIPDWTEKAYGKRGPVIKKYIRKLYALDKKVDEGEYEVFTADGKKIVWDFSSASLGKMNDGRVLVISMANDVTKRKQAEKELIKLSRAIEQSPVSIIITDLKGTIEYVNPKVTQITGYLPSELIGQKPSIFNTGTKSEETYAKLWQTISNGNQWFGEFLNKKKNGELFWENASISPIMDVKGKVTHYIAVKEDITTKKKTEKEFNEAKNHAEESKLLFEGLFNNSTVGLYQTTPDGKILSVNPTLIKMLKFDSLEEILKRNLSNGSYLDQEKRKQFKSILTEKGEIIDYESEWVTKNGETIKTIESARVAKDKNGEIIRYDGVVENITEKVILINDLKIAKEKAEESDRLKSAFLANMSHEIRTPMNGILGFSELLKTPNLSGDEQQLYISVIEKSGERMLNIINDIISISKIESGLMEVRIQESNMNEQIEYVYKFFKPEIEAKGIQFSFKELLSVKEATINTDREKVYAVLTNLVKNAIKFTEKGTIEFGYHIKGNFLEFYVKDSGIGVPKDRQEAIFERFIQADIDDKMARQGAGLGLSISKAYVEMLGGKLWVESEEGKGSLFYFTLPCDAETKGENERIIDNTDTIVESPLKKLKILIVDDDETSSWLLGQMLKKLDREVLYAENGLKAVEICGNNPDIDLILMDIKMDIMDGYEATRQIRQFNNKSFIIAQTAFALAGDRERAIEAGCNEYISKPITQNKLLSMIKGHFAA